MKIVLGFLFLVSCGIHHVTSIGYGPEVESWRINGLNPNQNPNVINPLLGSSASLNVYDKLQNIRNKLEEIEKKNNDFPVISPVRGPENHFYSINSFIDNLSTTDDNKEQANPFEIRPVSMLENIPEVPSSLNGYFLMFRLKQNVSNSAPTKSQSRFIGNEQQQFIQQISTQKPEPAVNQQQPFTIHRQSTSQQSLNNQQMQIRRLNIQNQSSNHGNPLHNQQNSMNQQQSANNQEHHLTERQRSTNENQQISTQRSQDNSQQFSSNEGSMSNGLQNRQRPVSNGKTSMNQQHSARKVPQTFQQQPTSNTHVPSEQGILSISHQSTINQYIRPQSRITERISSNVPMTENPARIGNNFEYPSGQQIQALADEIIAKIQTQVLNGESHSAFADNLNRNAESKIMSTTTTSHPESTLTDLESTSVMPDNGGQITYEARPSTGASVKHHLKTPYANYDFTHLL